MKSLKKHRGRLALPIVSLLVLSMVSCELLGPEEEDTGGGDGSDSMVQVDPEYNFQPDPNDATPLAVVDGVPANNSSGVAPGSTVIFYFDDIVNPGSLNSQSFTVVEGGAEGSNSGISASAVG